MATEYPQDPAAIDPSAAFSQGVASVDQEDPQAAAKARECADVKKWHKEITAARKFDEQARKQYAIDRRYARSDRGGFTVDVPIAQSYIDVLQSFLYAKNPDLDVTPSGMTDPPPQKAIEAMVREQLAQVGQQAQSQAAQAMPQAGAQPPPPGMVKSLLGRIMGGAPTPGPGQPPLPDSPPPGGPPQGQPGQPPPNPQQSQKETDTAVKAKVAEMMAPYQKKREDAKQLAETLELVIHDSWRKAKLKAAAKLATISALTVGIGWLKASWLEREGKDPIIEGQIRDAREQLSQIAATKAEIDSGMDPNVEQKQAQLEQQIAGLEQKVDILVARGLVIDFVPAEDMQVSTDVRQIAQYNDASWLAMRAFKSFAQIRADYKGLKDDDIRKITKYWPVKPKDTRDDDTGRAATSVRSEEADAYTKTGSFGGAENPGVALDTSDMPVAEIPAFGCIWEVWDRRSGVVLTLAEGCDYYLLPAEPPQVSSFRGHPFFAVIMGSIDGRRHPRSYVERSAPLLDEYNAVRSNYKKHRARCIPKSGFDSSQYSQDEIAKLEKAISVEMVPLKSLTPGHPIRDAIVTIAYPPIDMALYDTGTIRAELEIVWGIQEALSSSIRTAKTATEAQIQQQGTNSRTGYQKDGIDSMLTDLASYCGEIMLQVMNEEDVQEIAGPWSLWPQRMSIDDLHALVTIDIVAGSTGKPDTAMQQQVWTQLLPMLKNTIEEIGKLRMSTNDEIADCLESLVEETVRRSGDRVDANQFMPDPPAIPPPPPQPPPIPLNESALMGPQTAELVVICANVRGGLVSPKAAKAMIMAAYPHIPDNLVDEMVNGSLPQPTDAPTQIDSKHVGTVPQPTLPPPPGPAAMPQGVTQ
jgi:hypothetical protein